MTRTDDKTSISEHRSHLAEHLQHVRDSGRPMFITTDGEPVAVVLSAAVYDELVDRAEHARSLEMLDRSIADIQAGRTSPASRAISDIAEELGLQAARPRSQKQHFMFANRFA